MLKYEQSTGKLFDATGKLLGTGYSGKDPHKNNPAAEGIEDLGPIPRGVYKLTAMEETTAEHGPYVIVLAPDDATRAKILALNRQPDTFRIHGNSLLHPGAASAGCVIQPRPVRVQIWTGTDHDLEVV